MFWPFLNPILFLLAISCADAATNITIDDTEGDPLTGKKPVYVPIKWQGPECTGCSVQPDKNLASRGTWSAWTYKPENGPISITLSFKGTAIHVYFIVPNAVEPVEFITTEAACEFNLDGKPAGVYNHTPTSSPAFDYNTLVYSNPTLENDDHKLVISTTGLTRNIFLAFDYATYTTDDTPVTSLPKGSVSSTPTESPTNASNPANRGGSSVPVAAIAGGVCGFVAVLALILFFFLCRRKLKRKALRVSRAVPSASSSSGYPAPVVVPSRQWGAHDDHGLGGSNIHPDARNRILETPQMPHQAELADMRTLKQEVRQLKREVETDINHGSAGGSRRMHNEGTIAVLQSQTMVMREQIGLLRTQQLMRGSSDDPPPYSG